MDLKRGWWWWWGTHKEELHLTHCHITFKQQIKTFGPRQSQSSGDAGTRKDNNLYSNSSCFTREATLIRPVRENIKGEHEQKTSGWKNTTPGGMRFSSDSSSRGGGGGGGGVLYISWCSFEAVPTFSTSSSKVETATAFHHPTAPPTPPLYTVTFSISSPLSLMFHSCCILSVHHPFFSSSSLALSLSAVIFL